MPKQSAGLILYRTTQGSLEVLLVHPGGPYWAKKDLEAWSIPKGEYHEQEEALEAAIREFENRLDSLVPDHSLSWDRSSRLEARP